MPNRVLEREDWLEHARAWKKSGLSCAEYSEREGLKPSTLSWWTWKLRELGETIPGGKRTRTAARKSAAKPKRRRRAKATAAVSFVELAPLSVEPPEPSSTIELDVRGLIVRVRAGFDHGTLARVLDVVEARR